MRTALNPRRLPPRAGSGKLAACIVASEPPVRPVPRLLVLTLSIAFSLQAQAGDDFPQNWGLCPLNDVIPPFTEFTQTTEGVHIDDQNQPTDIESDQLAGTDVNPIFRGNVTMRNGAQFMGADEITYDQAQGRYTAGGNIRYQAQGMRLRADRAEGNQNTDSHTLEDIRYQLLARRGNGTAKSANLTGDTGSLYGATYSTCAPEARHWELSARRIDVDQKTGMATAHGASLKIGNVPVLYLPWLMFPTDDRRRSGLLYPQISNSGRNGFDWRQPIYLNIAPNMDATLSPRYMSRRGGLLDGQFRYLNEHGRGTFDALWMPHDDLRDSRRWRVHYDALQDFGSHWQARANVNWISDPRYFEDFTNSIDGLSQSTAYSAIGLYGRGKHWDASLSADHWQLADYTLSDWILPYDRLPRAAIRWQRPLGDGPLRFGFEAEAVRFHHPQYPAGARFDIKPWISLPLEGDAWFLRPTLAFRQTGYSLDHALAQALGGASPSRGQSIFSVDAGVFFDRQLQFKGRSYLQTIEPRLFYLNVPYTDQDAMPVFDSQPLTFGWAQMFRDNRYSGGDRQADANQLTLAVSTRMIRQSDGRERFSASLGQIRYFRDSRVHLPGEPLTEKGRSAWVADVNYAPTDRWTVGASYQRDPKFQRTDLASLRARYLFPNDGVINLSYRYRRALLEQVDFSFLYPINPTWSVVGRHYYSLRDSKTLEGLMGVQWDSCCIAVRLVGRRYMRNRDGRLDNTLMLEIELKGLGGAGQDTRSTLRRAILGYNRDDLYLVPPQTATGQPFMPDRASTNP